MKKVYLFFLMLGLFASTSSAQDYTITFQIDMTDYLDGGGSIDPSGMHIAGNFQDEAGLGNEWTPADGALTDQGNNIWSITVTLPAGTYEYKYVLGNDWGFGSENISGPCGPGNGNRQIVVDADKTEAYCFDKCTECGVVTPTVKVTFQVDMTNMITKFGQPDMVSVAGGFQGWAPGQTVMSDDDGNNVYEVTVEVDANSTLSYKFLFGDSWGYDESVPASCNSGGNRSASVGTTDEVLPVVCFGSCDETCPSLGTPLNVTFIADLTNEIVSANGVHLAGTLQFPSWRKDEWEMTDADGNGVYSLRIENVFPGEYQYKFINGNSDGEEETADFIAGGCGIDNGVGGSNRLLDLTAASGEVVVQYVYNSCDESSNGTQTDIDNAAVIYLGSSNLVNTTAIENLRIYPNPISSSATVEFVNPNNELFDLVITDFTGRQVFSKNNFQNTLFTIQRGNLASGIYFATFRDKKGGQLTQKLIIQ